MKRLVLIIGPSGSGKSTLEQNLCKHFGFRKAVSTTTRMPRRDEMDGVDYNFITQEEFLARKDFLESAVFDENYYGLTLEEVLKNQNDLVAVVEVYGALQINQYVMFNLFTEVQLLIVYMDIPREECAANMEKRGDEKDTILKRATNETIPQLFIASHLRPDVVETKLDEATHRRIGERLDLMKIEIKPKDIVDAVSKKLGV